MNSIMSITVHTVYFLDIIITCMNKSFSLYHKDIIPTLTRTLGKSYAIIFIK